MRLLLAVAAASVSTSPVFWTPVKMVSALKALNYPRASVLGGRCAGTSRRHGRTFSAFRCRITWQYGGVSGVSTVWARPLPGGHVCASTRSLATCTTPAPGPLPGDPTVCAYTDAVSCAHDAARAAILAKHPPPLVNLVCTQGATVDVWSCSWSGGAATVTFAKGATGWTTTVQG